MKIGIIGFGNWGKIWANKIITNGRLELVGVCDIDGSREAVAKEMGLSFFKRYDKLLNLVDSVIIAASETTHADISRTCLKTNKHVLVEKPAALFVKDAQELVNIAKNRGLVFMVDHTFRYDKSYIELKSTIKDGLIGNLKRIWSYRFSFNIEKPEIGVIADLMPHDLSLFINLISYVPESWEVRVNRLRNRHGDSADIRLDFGCISTNSYLSWVYPLARREMFFIGTKGTMSWLKKDGDTDILKHHRYISGNKLELFREWEVGNKGATLTTVLDHFVDCINQKLEPETSVKSILPEVRVLDELIKESR